MSRGTDRVLALTGCGLALTCLVPVALFQSGLIERLPDPPGEVFDSERITSSKTAHPLGIPDSYLGLGSYGVTLGLLLLSRRNRTARRLLGAKLAVDGAVAASNSVLQVVRFGKLCSWCTGTALATAVMVVGGRRAIAETGHEAKELL